MELKMKFIREQVEDVQYITEGTDEKKSLYICGTFAQANIGNRNRRFYPLPVLENEVSRYIRESIQTNRAVGELNHPDGPNINLDRACILIKEMRRDGNNFIGKAKVTSTPSGQVVAGLISDGLQLGVSTRALGSLKLREDGLNEVQNDLRLIAVDVVSDPSAPGAYVNSLMENRDWVFDAASGSWRAQEIIQEHKKIIRRSTLNEIEKRGLKLFEQYLRAI